MTKAIISLHIKCNTTLTFFEYFKESYVSPSRFMRLTGLVKNCAIHSITHYLAFDA